MTTDTLSPRSAGEPQVDLCLYRVAHSAMQKGARDLAELAGRLAEGMKLTPRRATDLQTYVRLLCHDIHHHSGEDQIGWPIIAGSAAGQVDLTPFSADHDELDPIIDALRAAADRLAADPGDRTAVESLHRHAVRMRDLLDEHIAEEERELFPIISEYVSVADFKKWEKAMMKTYPMKDLWFLISLSVSSIAPQETAETVALTPVPFRVIRRLSAGKYRRFHQRLFG